MQKQFITKPEFDLLQIFATEGDSPEYKFWRDVHGREWYRVVRLTPIRGVPPTFKNPDDDEVKFQDAPAVVHGRKPTDDFID